jgi:hypothetical protein
MQPLRNSVGDRDTADATGDIIEPDDGFGGHESEYEQVTDLFRCMESGSTKRWPATRMDQSNRARAWSATAATPNASTCC